MRSSLRAILSTTGTVLGIALASISAAQSSDNPDRSAPVKPYDPSPAIEQRNIAKPAVPSEFGTASYSILQIGAAAFHPRDTSGTQTYDNTGLIHQTGGLSDWWAPINLPEGALVYYMDIYACDSNPTNHMRFFFSGYSGSDTPGTTDFWFIDTTQVTSPVSGCGYWVSTPAGLFSSYQINNDVQYNSGFDYVAIARFGATDGSNKLKGIDLWWKRQVHPGPATATFGDVPTSSPQFKFVEALVAAGITAGCGSGNYCPNDPVTRGQMAVFISVALGLHWPY